MHVKFCPAYQGIETEGSWDHGVFIPTADVKFCPAYQGIETRCRCSTPSRRGAHVKFCPAYQGIETVLRELPIRFLLVLECEVLPRLSGD